MTYCVAYRRIAGDMQLTKAEIAQTQIIVTTPEKWDVVTRKPTGEGEIAFVSRIFRISLIAYDLWTEYKAINYRRSAFIERRTRSGHRNDCRENSKTGIVSLKTL